MVIVEALDLVEVEELEFAGNGGVSESRARARLEIGRAGEVRSSSCHRIVEENLRLRNQADDSAAGEDRKHLAGGFGGEFEPRRSGFDAMAGRDELGGVFDRLAGYPAAGEEEEGVNAAAPVVEGDEIGIISQDRAPSGADATELVEGFGRKAGEDVEEELVREEVEAWGIFAFLLRHWRGGWKVLGDFDSFYDG